MLFGGHGGNAGEVHGADAEELAGHCHGVGGELASAGARAGAGGGLDGLEVVVGDLARGVRADGLKDVEDGDVLMRSVGLREAAGERWSRRRA